MGFLFKVNFQLIIYQLGRNNRDFSAIIESLQNRSVCFRTICWVIFDDVHGGFL